MYNSLSIFIVNLPADDFHWLLFPMKRDSLNLRKVKNPEYGGLQGNTGSPNVPPVNRGANRNVE